VADIDGDGKLEVLHGEFGGWVRCLNVEDGSLAWQLAVDMHSWIQTAPTLLDADGDGGMDFIVATWNSTAGDTNTIRAYRCSDRTLLWSVPLAAVTYHGTTVADLDRDGRPELAIGDYSGVLTVLNAEDGSIAWTLPSRGPGHYIGAPVTAGDLDGDGSCELVAVSWYNVLALTGDGRSLWTHDIDGYATAFRGAALADVDGDALPDAVFGTSSGRLVALSGLDGTLLWSVDLAATYGDSRFELDHAPVIADFDDDGELDVFIVGGHTEYPDYSGNFGRAYALSIGRGEGPPWLMFQQNHARSSSICPGETNAIRFLADGGIPDLSLYPMPVRDALFVEQEDLRSCVILDAAGRAMATVHAAGGSASIDVSTLPRGFYFLLAQGEGGFLVRSFIKE
jgi:outer membrane protein assembly factor BamB